MGIIIWLLFYRKHSTKLNETTKFTTENFLLWYGLWNSGDTIYKARATPQLSTQTIRTLHISDQHRSLIGNKLDGHCISQNLMWNWSINWDRRWFNQMPCPADLTSFRNMTQIMRTWHSYLNICFWIYSISPCRIESWTWDESTISWRVSPPLIHLLVPLTIGSWKWLKEGTRCFTRAEIIFWTIWTCDGHFRDAAWSWDCWTPWWSWDFGLCRVSLLVARTPYVCAKLCEGVQHVPAI